MAIDKKKEVPKELAVFLNEPKHIEKFIKVSGSPIAANQYVQSALIAIADSEELRKCTPQSIFQSVLRAASLGLSCDPAVKQAWIVPFNKKIKGKNGQADTWIKVAQFQPHYMGLYQLAMRTGKYWQINVSPIYQGDEVFEDPITGRHYVQQEGSDIISEPIGANPAYYRKVTIRKSGDKDRKIIGWIGFFETKKGFKKTTYMSVDEINEHAERFVKDLGKNQNWQDAEKRKTMEMKTVLKSLLNWADKSGTVQHTDDLNKALKIDNGEQVIDAVTVVDDETGEIIPEQTTEPKKEETK